MFVIHSFWFHILLVSLSSGLTSGISDDAKTQSGFGSGMNNLYMKHSLCPNISDNVLGQYRFDPVSRTCSRTGVQSHCGQLMIFFGVIHNDIYGECDCNYQSVRPLIYEPKTKRCYHIYSQAYCSEKHWLTFGRDGQPECVPNKCRNWITSSNSKDVYVPLNGDGPCVRLYDTTKLCPNWDDIVSFNEGELTPKCCKQIPSGRALGAMSNNLRCRPGTYMNIVGKCQPPFIW